MAMKNGVPPRQIVAARESRKAAMKMPGGRNKERVPAEKTPPAKARRGRSSGLWRRELASLSSLPELFHDRLEELVQIFPGYLGFTTLARLHQLDVIRRRRFFAHELDGVHPIR